MNAPGSLILPLLNAYEDAASVKDKDGLLPVDLAVNGEYSGEVILRSFQQPSFTRIARNHFAGRRDETHTFSFWK